MSVCLLPSRICQLDVVNRKAADTYRLGWPNSYLTMQFINLAASWWSRSRYIIIF